MGDLLDIFKECLSYNEEQEWFDFKSNYISATDLGEYISALSNSAALLNRESAYLFFGVDDSTHFIKGTSFNFNRNERGEPLQHYLARSLNPSIAFTFKEFIFNNKRIVSLIIPPTKTIPCSFNNNRYIRIGSSKVNIRNYPEREVQLFSILTFGNPTIISIESENQNLTFKQLFGYYGSKGIVLNPDNFEENLNLRNKEGKYNLLAELLSDNMPFSIRIPIFSGLSKSSELYSIKEFGHQCLLYSLDDILRYGDVLNIIKVDEMFRIVERKDSYLFDKKAFREAIINAFLHNKWIDKNVPMVTFYSNRLEILSRGTLPPKQTRIGFFNGHSIPVNEKLSEIFLQLHLSEKTGRGVPIIRSVYTESAFKFLSDDILITIPYKNKVFWSSNISVNGTVNGTVNDTISSNLKSTINIENNNVNDTVNGIVNDTVNGTVNFSTTKYKNLSDNERKILLFLFNNPLISSTLLSKTLKISQRTVKRNLKILKEKGCIKRIGSDKNGSWKVIIKN